MSLIILSFFAGILTVLAPCVLPLLPVILGASATDPKDKYKPYIIIASLSISVIIFSLALKATTYFIDIPDLFWKIFTGTILILFGIITIFPNLWKNISTKLGFSSKSNEKLQKSANKKGAWGDIMVGFSLGPVFSSCSPTYALILAVILPTSFATGLINLIAYTMGLGLVLLLIAILGQKFISKMKFVSDPNGIFKKILGILILLVGFAIIFGIDKQIETIILDSGYLNLTEFEDGLLDKVKEK